MICNNCDVPVTSKLDEIYCAQCYYYLINSIAELTAEKSKLESKIERLEAENQENDDV